MSCDYCECIDQTLYSPYSTTSNYHEYNPHNPCIYTYFYYECIFKTHHNLHIFSFVYHECIFKTLHSPYIYSFVYCECIFEILHSPYNIALIYYECIFYNLSLYITPYWPATNSLIWNDYSNISSSHPIIVQTMHSLYSFQIDTCSFLSFIYTFL